MTSRLTTPFGRESTAAEVLKGVDLTGKRAIVTGGASGIGVETARALAGAGAEVTIAVRNQEAGRRTAPTASTALATGLHPALAQAGGARVVSVSSAAHLRSPVVFDDIHFAHRAYEPWSAYGQSKTANVLFAVEATRRWAGDGILVNALHSVASGPTCSATSPRTSSTACAATPRPAGRPPSKELRHRYWRQHRPPGRHRWPLLRGLQRSGAEPARDPDQGGAAPEARVGRAEIRRGRVRARSGGGRPAVAGLDRHAGPAVTAVRAALIG